MNAREESLISRAQAGDLAAFEDLVRAYQDMAYRIACRIVGSPDDAQDVCQESFIKLHRVIGKYRPRHKFSTWLYRLVVNTAIDFLRRERHPGHVPLEESADVTSRDTWPYRDLRLSVDQLLDGLSPKQRVAFALRDLQGFPLDEVARILNCSAITVRVHLHAARRRLRDRLENDAND